MKAQRVAFVVQRYGLEVLGGAEMLCRRLAEHLCGYVEMDVLTTCAVNYQRWANDYPPGVTELNGVRVRRFCVDRPRDPQSFWELTAKLLDDRSNVTGQLEWMWQQGPFSSDLLRTIASERDHYDVFVFFTYLYSTTYYGLQLVPDKAVLVPTAHDENAIHFDIFRAVFNLPRFLIYLTESERKLVQRLFNNTHISSAVVGVGTDVPADVSGERFRAKYGLSGDFVVYVGRVDTSKNVDGLFEDFIAFREHYDRDLKLVILGRGSALIPQHPDIVPLGFVTEEDKFDGLQAASVLILPSRYESLSIAVLEAWKVGTPVLVNGACEVLKEQCRLGHGGLWYQTPEEFALALRTLLARPDLRARLASSGQAFVEATYSWDSIEHQYLEILQRFGS